MEFIYEPNTNKKFQLNLKRKSNFKKIYKIFHIKWGMYKRMTAYEALGLPEQLL